MSDKFDLAQLGDIPDPFAPVERPATTSAPPAASSPTRAQLATRRAVAAVAVVAYEVGWVAVVEHRRDLGSLPPSAVALGLFVPLAVAALAVGAVGARGRRGLGLPAAWLASLSVLPALLFAVGTMLTSPPEPETDHFWSLAARCMAIAALLTAGPLAAGALVMRHAFVAASVGRTAALGAACGALAAATMSVACWHSGALHVVVGHGAMIVVGAVAGAILGRRITRA